jgi:hypothetical protein
MDSEPRPSPFVESLVHRTVFTPIRQGSAVAEAVARLGQAIAIGLLRPDESRERALEDDVSGGSSKQPARWHGSAGRNPCLTAGRNGCGQSSAPTEFGVATQRDAPDGIVL